MENVRKQVDKLSEDLITLSEYILANPELGNQEFKAYKAHVDLLKQHDFTLIENYLGIETAFRAEFKSKIDGPTICFLSEYDALPEIGHGCGHNLLGATSTGAGIVLSKLMERLGGTIVVLGTPAEETRGAKVTMAEQGIFDSFDAAMMAHPSHKHYASGQSLAIEALAFTFHGKTAHAAASPEKGINALDAVINTFNHINALREHISADARIHGIIRNGGAAANIVPDLAIAEFYVRARTKSELTELVEKVKNCARGASLASGTSLEISNYEYAYDNLMTNQTLSNTYIKNLKTLGIPNVFESGKSYGSSDIGNVSHQCPTIHPYFSISESEIIAHTTEFRDATKQPYAYENMKIVISSLVLTAIDILTSETLLHQIKDEFNQSKA